MIDISLHNPIPVVFVANADRVKYNGYLIYY